MKKIILFFAIILCYSLFLSGQEQLHILNGGFEFTRATECYENLSTEDFNNLMPFVYSFGTYPEADILKTNCHVITMSGQWCVGLASRTGIDGNDAIALELYSVLKKGQSYQIEFLAMANETENPLLDSLQIGISSTSQEMGQIIYAVKPPAERWEKYTVDFIPENDVNYITVGMTKEFHSGWVMVDDFSFTHIPPPETITLEFTDNKLLLLPEFYTQSTNICYGHINELLPEDKFTDFTFQMPLDLGFMTIPCETKYLGDGLLQFNYDFSELYVPMDLQIVFPDTLKFDDYCIIFNNKPETLSQKIVKIPVNKSLEVLGGGSVGIKLILDGAGAGASAATASMACDDAFGLGLNFSRDANGNDFITRKFNAEFALTCEAPSINAIVGDIQAGLRGRVYLNADLGQTMLFPATLETETLKMAKAAYILETIANGSVACSPGTFLVLQALIQQLKKINPDLNNIYSDLDYSIQTGVTLGGSLSLGANIEIVKGLNFLRLSLVEGGIDGACFYRNVMNLQNTNVKHEFGIAGEFSCSLFKSMLGSGIVNQRDFIRFPGLLSEKVGFEFGAGGEYDDINGIHYVKSFLTLSNNAQINLVNPSIVYQNNFIIPRPILDKLTEPQNVIFSIARLCNPTLLQFPILIGPSIINQSLIDACLYSADNYLSIDNHILIELNQTSTKGIKLDAMIDLDAALGIGLGLKFGIKYYLFDKLSQPDSKYTIADHHLLPLVECAPLDVSGTYYPIQEELVDLFEGVILLIKEPLKEIVKTVEIIIKLQETAKIIIGEKLAELLGTTVDGVKWIIRYFDLEANSIMKSSFSDPKIVHVCSSRSVKYLSAKSAGNTTNEESVLYIVSPNFNINLYDEADHVVEFFSPMSLAIGIDNQKINELGFGYEEKQLARIYRYDTDTMMWFEMPGDANASIDTVTTQITQSASYAVGIAVRPSMDKTAPEIREIYPRNGDNINPITQFHAQLYESPVGVGIDFSLTMIKIDGVEADAFWNPVDNIISYTPADSLTDGTHIFEVVATDYNGNRSTLKSTVTIGDVTDLQWTNHSITFNCYPVPVNDQLMISVNSFSPEIMTVSICNYLGQPVSSILTSYPINGQVDVEWHRTDANNQPVLPGVYFVQIKQGKNIAVKKVIVD